jgi:hypothetical protein
MATCVLSESNDVAVWKKMEIASFNATETVKTCYDTVLQFWILNPLCEKGEGGLQQILQSTLGIKVCCPMCLIIYNILFTLIIRRWQGGRLLLNA